MKQYSKSYKGFTLVIIQKLNDHKAEVWKGKELIDVRHGFKSSAYAHTWAEKTARKAA